MSFLPAKVILASTSAIRKTILENAGVTFETMRPALDEDEAKASLATLPAAELALKLAEAKSRSLSNLHPAAIVIGADQTLLCDGLLFNKPRDRSEARAMLMQLRGRKHTLQSALAGSQNDQLLWRHVSEAHLTMRNFSEAFLENYLEANGDDLLTSVGAYKLEQQGIQLFDTIEGDYHTILGLPVLPLLAFLREQKVIPT